MKNVSFVFLLIFTVSCQKARLEVEGQAINPLSGEGVEGIEIEIRKTKKNAWASDEPYKKVVSGANGEFSYLHQNSSLSYTYNISVYDESSHDYFILRIRNMDDNSLHSAAYYPFEGGTKLNMNVEVAPKAFIDLSLENINCFNEDDRIKIEGEWGSIAYSIPTLQEYNFGCVNSRKVEPIPEGIHYLTIEVTRNSVTTISQDTIQVGAGDTLFYQVQY